MLRVAFFGAGRMARQHLSALRRTGREVAVAGVYDPIPEHARELAAASGARAFESMARLMDEARPHAVHVCSPPATHFDAAVAALNGGAAVYVEKPFARTGNQARGMIALAAARRLVICAGHQLLRDPAYLQLMDQASSLGTIVQIDSAFAFRSVAAPTARGPRALLARELLDIVPHPLYTLVAALERFSHPSVPATLEWLDADPVAVQATLRAGGIVGRLSVSLRARPVASSITVTGTGGSLTCDFVRSMVIGTGNPGTTPIEKIFNPLIEGGQLAVRTVASLGRRLRTGAAYPGLTESIAAFYDAVADQAPAPLALSHLLTVSDLFEQIAARVEAAAHAHRPARRRQPDTTSGPSAALTGARGFLGAEIAKRLPRVRGLGRSGWPGDPSVTEWVTADLSRGLKPEVLANVDVVVHAAAETSGGFLEHERNTITATTKLLAAMHAAGPKRLVLVSSLSVIDPPRSLRECQDERTPRLRNPRALGPYAWGKTMQEALVLNEAERLGIEVRVIRPGALIDLRDPSLPGIVGRRLFGAWHLGLGRPSLPVAVCDVGRCADAIAWCVRHFDEAPPIVNLFESTIATRGDLRAVLREHGWNGRICWVPISAIAAAYTTVRTLPALARGRLPERLDVWSVLRPRRYDDRLASQLLTAAQPPSSQDHAEALSCAV